MMMVIVMTKVNVCLYCVRQHQPRAEGRRGPVPLPAEPRRHNGRVPGGADPGGRWDTTGSKTYSYHQPMVDRIDQLVRIEKKCAQIHIKTIA